MTMEEKAVTYQKIRRRLTLFHLLLTPMLLFILLGTGLTFGMRTNAIAATGGNEWLVGAIYFFLFSVYFLIFDLPLAYYSGFILEHHFGLSNQNFRGWLAEFVKKALLGFGFSLLLVEALYFLIRQFPQSWWLWSWAVYAFVSYIMGKLFPVLIVPIFYKYEKLNDPVLEGKIRALTARFGMPVENVYSLNLSKTTQKANAAFMGIGRTKRIVLSDTLVSHFTHPEIEVVLAHELGHYKHHDIWRFLGFGLLFSFLAFMAGFWGMTMLMPVFSLGSSADVAGLPLLLLIFYTANFIFMPFQNAYARHRENQADLFALRACSQKESFISCMNKLADQNMADRNPPRWYEWLFYDHPSIQKRIQKAQGFQVNS